MLSLRSKGVIICVFIVSVEIMSEKIIVILYRITVDNCSRDTPCSELIDGKFKYNLAFWFILFLFFLLDNQRDVDLSFATSTSAAVDTAAHPLTSALLDDVRRQQQKQ